METVGRYQALHKLGAGGMAEVLLGRTTGEGGFEKLVAIKRILPSMSENESFVKMFIDEATISAKLNHSSIGQIFEFGKAGDSYFIAMEYIQGVDLRSIHRIFRKIKRPPIPELGAYIMMHVCAALEYAHSKADNEGKPLNIIHRDLSPSNVLVSFEGEVKLIDFGIAKAAQRLYVTVGANLKGKYAYMSPEQAFGQPVDHRSDIFGAGTLLFELLTGRNPFRADTDLATLQRVQAARVPAPSRVVKGVDAELDRITAKALAQQVVDRYQTAGEMQEDLEVYSKRSAFSSRRMALWMKEVFREEIDKTREVLKKARAEASAAEAAASAGSGLLVVPSSELRQAGSGQPVVQVASQQLPPDVTPIPIDPTAMQFGGTPTGPPTPGPPHEPRYSRGDPSSRSVATMPPGGMVPSPEELTLAPSVGRPLQRRSNLTAHVVIFTIIVAGVAAGLYFGLGKKLFQDTKPIVQSTGSVVVTLEPPFPAEVYVDGNMRGKVDTGREFAITGLLAGKHRIKVMGNLIITAEEIVDVVRGQTRRIQLKVKPKVSEEKN